MTAVSDLGRVRQALLAGRIAEAVTLRPLPPKVVLLELLHDGTARAMPVDFSQGDGGWYAVSTSGLPAVPVPPLTGPARLRLTVSLADGRSHHRSVGLDDAELERVARPVSIGGTMFDVAALAGAPFVLDVLFDPRPVALAGIVIGDHDPARPVAGATVSIGGQTATTGSDGRFRLGPLPVATVLDITVSHGATDAIFPFRPDYTTRLNRTELSIPL